MAQREHVEGNTGQRAEQKQRKEAPAPQGNRRRVWKRIGIGALSVVVVVGAAFVWAMQSSRYPDRINMGTCGMQGMDMGNMSMDGMTMSGTNTTQGTNSSTTCTSVDSLQAPITADHIDTFDLTAQPAHLSFGAGQSADAWTFNGTSPGPTLRVKQGDLVVVHVTNHLSTGVTIHWHGIAVPNSADGVAGVTQNAIKPGETYTYRFIAKDAGTYWYHSHQESFEETGHGLFGMIVVDPAQLPVHDDVDVPIALHSWNNALTLNGTANTLKIPAQPGQWVRLRLVNTGNNPQPLTIVGAPFQVAALDGHDLHNPGFLTGVPVAVDAGQRFDLRFQMPEHGSVALLAADEKASTYHKTPAALIGLPGSTLTSSIPNVGKFFDFAANGQPEGSAITMQSHFDASYTITLGYTFGFSNGRPGPVFTLDEKSFPQTPMLVVHPGQLVKLHFENNNDSGIHPLHLHGHTFQVLTKNGKPLTGSPVYLDTLSVHPHESYDVAFVADNPGLWMIHCHNLFHANHGMDMMLVYSNISTPYSIGNASGNFPD